MMQKKWLKITLIGAVIALSALTIVNSLRKNSVMAPRSEADYLHLLSQVKTMVAEKYVDKIDDKKLVEGAVAGMLAALDPHSAYLPPVSFTEMNVEISGSFGGLGIEINMTEGKLTVISPIDDTPAFRAGIKAGDHIFKIDGKPTGELSINEAVKRMRGPKDTSVTLTILRKSSPKPLEFVIVRDIIKTKSLKARSIEPGVGYVRISHFQARTGEDFGIALEKLRKESGGNLRGLVLDLRNNPGGLLEAAAAVAGRFIDGKNENGLIVSTRGREVSSQMMLTTGLTDKEPRYPVVVLINGGSASASEIVAGALQDHKRGIVMGTQSFGKGSVQTIMSLRNGAGLKLTTALYYTPSGRSIQAKGITPDIVVESRAVVAASPAKKPAFHEKDLENHLGNGAKEEKQADPPLAPVVSPTKPVDPVKEADEKDYQLSRAVELIKGLTLLGKVK